ncbi:MAG: hypothetical protein IJ641_08980 [Lachnospiraceae bacterium]|nr:hypothetical protein [Lachnospiraceae bacterium]
MITLSQLVEGLSDGYLAAQAAVITMLFVTGLLFTRASMSRISGSEIWAMLLAFPAGLAMFAVSGYMMLCLGIPFNTWSVMTAVLLETGVSLYIIYRRNRLVDINNNSLKASGTEQRPDSSDVVDINGDKRIVFLYLTSFAVVFVIAFMLTANPFKIVVDNDSFFYFSAYPNAIVSEGRYIRYFDVFLTDAAPIGSIVQTLPYLFGFSETFGIQYFLDLDFILIFLYALYSELTDFMGKREAVICSMAAVLFLITSSAYLTTAKWIMAGVYFMSYYFITAYIGYMFSKKQTTERAYVLLGMMIVMTSMLRHEGVMLSVVLILTLSALAGYKGRELALSCILPMLIASVLYYIRVFVILDVHPLYAFLTSEKAIFMVAVMLICFIYLLFIRDRLPGRLITGTSVILPVVIILANMALFLLRGKRYLGNLYMFYLNLRIGAGWGYFGYIALFTVILLVIRAFIRKETYILFFDSLMVSYVFAVLLVAFGRGDSLRKGVGDSGNRVMLTAVPLIVFAIVLRVFIKPKDRGSSGQVIR